MKNSQGFTAIEGLLILIIIGLIGGTGYYVWKARNNTNNTYNTAGQANDSVMKHAPKADPYSGWKSYKSGNEGFTLKYPSDWTINIRTNGPPGDITELVDIKAPDGLIVRYAGLGKTSSDFAGCGHGGACMTQNVLSINSIKIPNHSNVKLVKSLPNSDFQDTNGEATDNNCFSVDLDEPSSAATTPKIGKNSFSDHYIQYSLPAKNGGRFVIFTTNEYVPNTTSGEVITLKCSDLTQSEFFNKTSVQQAEKILKSLTY